MHTITIIGRRTGWAIPLVWAAAGCASQSGGGGVDAHADALSSDAPAQDVPAKQEGGPEAPAPDSPDAQPESEPPADAGPEAHHVTCGATGKVLWSWAAGTGKAVSLAVLDDVTGDGKPDVAVSLVPFIPSDTDQFVYLFDGVTGKVVWTARPTSPSGLASASSAESDGVLERAPDLVPGDADTTDDLLFGTAGYGMAFALDGKTGKTIWSYETMSDGMAGWVEALVPVADLSGDGVPEIAFSGQSPNGVGHFVDGATGKVRWKLDLMDPGTSVWWTSPIGDLSGDGKPDVLFGTDRTNKVYAVDSSSGATLWQTTVGAAGTGPVIVLGTGDLDGDGKPDAIAGISKLGLVALGGAAGKPIWHYDLADSLFVYRLVSAGDLDGDGTPDVLLGSGCSTCPDGEGARIVSGKTGKLLWKGTASDFTWAVDPVGDIDGDGRNEVVEGAGPGEGKTRLYSGATGAKLWELSPGGGGAVKSVRGIPDVDGDGLPDVAMTMINPGRVFVLAGCPPSP